MSGDWLQERSSQHLLVRNCLSSKVTLWVRVDLASAHLRQHLGSTLEFLLDRGTEWVGFVGEGDPLASPGWAEVLHAFQSAGFRCMVSTPLITPLTRDQARLLAQCEELWLPAGPEPAERLRVLEAIGSEAKALGIFGPRVRRHPEAPGCSDAQLAGHTRGCLDPWEGLVLDAAGGSYPCAADRATLGDHRSLGLQGILESPLLQNRRADLLRGELPDSCRHCGHAPWVPLASLQEQVAAHAQRIPRATPMFTSREANALFRHWASEGKRVLIYPAGNHAQWLLSYAPELRRVLVAFGDRDPLKQGRELEGLPVWAPELITRERVDLLLLAAGKAEEAIRASLAGVEAQGIRLLSTRRIAREWRAVKSLSLGEGMRAPESVD